MPSMFSALPSSKIFTFVPADITVRTSDVVASPERSFRFSETVIVLFGETLVDGYNFTSQDDTVKIVEEIINYLSANDKIVIDFENVNLMTTTAAKSILQPIANKYGYNNIFSKLIFKNVSEDLKIIIATAIDGLQK